MARDAQARATTWPHTELLQEGTELRQRRKADEAGGKQKNVNWIGSLAPRPEVEDDIDI